MSQKTKSMTQKNNHAINHQNKKRTRCEVWTRVMGYHRPVSHFNVGKKSEHYSREHFEEQKSSNSHFCNKY